MLVKTIIGSAIALGLAGFAAADYVNIAAVAGMESGLTGTSDTGGDTDDMAEFVVIVTDVLADREKDQLFSNPEGRYQHHVGLGFALSRSNGNPLNGGCSSNVHLGNPHINPDESEGTGHSGCGEPSPAD